MSFQCVKFIFHPRFALNITYFLCKFFSFFVSLLTFHFIRWLISWSHIIYYLFVLSNEKATFNTLSQFNWTSTDRKKRLELLTKKITSNTIRRLVVLNISRSTRKVSCISYFLYPNWWLNATVYILCCIH